MTYRPAPRIRVISDNDYAGDPDGLFQLAHHALASSVELVGVIGSHLRPDDPWNRRGTSAQDGAVAARTVLDLAGRPDVPVVAGAESAIADVATPRRSAATDLILAEAHRDSPLPLYVVCGAGLSEVASAWLLDPTIAERLTVVWIGGPEHDGLAVAPPGAPAVEYNLAIDVAAGQVVLASDLPLWQVPRDAYRQTLVSWAELDLRVRPHGALGAHLAASLDEVRAMCAAHGLDIGETYVLGDSPLVLLTALQSSFEPDPSSSRWVERTVGLGADGRYTAVDVDTDAGVGDDPRPVRVFTQLDLRLMFEDLYARLALHAAG